MYSRCRTSFTWLVITAELLGIVVSLVIIIHDYVSNTMCTTTSVIRTSVVKGLKEAVHLTYMSSNILSPMTCYGFLTMLSFAV